MKTILMHIWRYVMRDKLERRLVKYIDYQRKGKQKLDVEKEEILTGLLKLNAEDFEIIYIDRFMVNMWFDLFFNEELIEKYRTLYQKHVLDSTEAVVFEKYIKEELLLYMIISKPKDIREFLRQKDLQNPLNRSNVARNLLEIFMYIEPERGEVLIKSASEFYKELNEKIKQTDFNAIFGHLRIVASIKRLSECEKMILMASER